MANPLSELGAVINKGTSGGIVRKLAGAGNGANVVDNIMAMMLGGNGSRAELRAAWQGMGQGEKTELVKKLAERYPNPRGNTGISPEGQFVVDFLQGRAEVSPERLEALNAVARESDIGSRTITSQPGGNVGKSGTPDPAQLVEPNLDAPSTGGTEFDPDAYLNSARPNNPLRSKFKDRTDVLDRISNKDPLRGPDTETTFEVVDTPEGKRRVPVRKPKEGTGRFDAATAKQMMTHGTGGTPRDVSDYVAELGNTTPQDKFDKDIVSFLQTGGKNRGSRDWLMDLWRQAAGADAPGDPRMAMDSPQQLAEFIASRVTPEVLLNLDPGIDASQIRDANRVIRGEQGKRFARTEAPLNPNQAERAVRENLPEIPRTPQQQLTRPMQRLVDEIKTLAGNRLGDTWGDQYKAMQQEAGGLGDLTEAAPESRLPEGFGEGPIDPRQTFEAGKGPDPGQGSLPNDSRPDRVTGHEDTGALARAKRIEDFRQDMIDSGDFTPEEIDVMIRDNPAIGRDPNAGGGRWAKTQDDGSRVRTKAPNDRDLAAARSEKWESRIDDKMAEFGPGLGIEGRPRSPRQIQAEMDSLYDMGLSEDAVDARMEELVKEMQTARRIAPHMLGAKPEQGAVDGMLSAFEKAASPDSLRNLRKSFGEQVKGFSPEDKAKLHKAFEERLTALVQADLDRASKEVGKAPGDLTDSRAAPDVPDDAKAAEAPKDIEAPAEKPQDLEGSGTESRVPEEGTDLSKADEDPNVVDAEKVEKPKDKTPEERAADFEEKARADYENDQKYGSGWDDPKHPNYRNADGTPVDQKKYDAFQKDLEAEGKAKDAEGKKKGIVGRGVDHVKRNKLRYGVGAALAGGGGLLYLNSAGDPYEAGETRPENEEANGAKLLDGILAEPGVDDDSETAIIRRLADERRARIAATAQRTAEFKVNPNTGTHKNWVK
jgi:hypothetical protein